MRVALVYAPFIPGYKPQYGLQPLGVLYIGALLRREGFDVSVLDADINGLTIAETVEISSSCCATSRASSRATRRPAR